MIQPGASVTVTIEFDPQYMASYDENATKANGTKGAWVLEAGDYYFAIGNGAHEAVNNILANQMGSDNGLVNITPEAVINGENAIVWNLAATDMETYSVNVENALQDANLNNFIEGVVEYTTRADWTKGWTPVTELTATEEMLVGLRNQTYSLSANGEPVTWGAANGLKLVDFIITDEDGNYAGIVDINDPQWDLLLDQITLDEAINYIEAGGDDLENIDSIGAPRTNMNDGPLGFVNDQVPNYSSHWTATNSGEPTYVDGKGEYDGYSMAVMPTEPVVAATFNKDLVYREGEMLGEEGLWSNTASIMGPGLNLHRSPYCARNHEYYSEDPMLTNLLGTAVCAGGLSRGEMMEPKHLAFNHMELNRFGVSTFFTEQAGRENELRGFQGAMANNYAMCVMTTFNRIGTVYGGADEGVQIQILRNEWGYTGGIITDMVNGADYMNWKDSVYGGGGSMLGGPTAWTDTQWGNMNENKALIASDAAFQQHMKQGLRYFLYSTAKSNAMNGITSNTSTVYVRTWWQNTILGVEIGLAALTLVSAGLGIKATLQGSKKKS